MGMHAFSLLITNEAYSLVYDLVKGPWSYGSKKATFATFVEGDGDLVSETPPHV